MESDELRIRELLIELKQSGDPALVSDLYDVVAPGVYRWARTQIADDQAVRRIVVNTFVALWSRSRRYDQMKPWTWVTLHALAALRSEQVAVTRSDRHLATTPSSA